MRSRVSTALMCLMAVGCGPPATPGTSVTGSSSSSSSSSSGGGGSSSSGGESSTSSSGGSSGTSGGSTSSSSSGATSSSSSGASSSSGTTSSSSSGGASSSSSSSSSGGASSSGGPLAGDTCETAEDVTGQLLVGNLTTVGYQDQFNGVESPTCWSGAGSGDRVHRLELASGKRLLAEVIPSAGFDAAVNLQVGTCTAQPFDCVAGADEEDVGGTEAASHVNSSGAAQQVYIIVDGYQGSTGTYTLRLTISDALPGESCTNVETVQAGLLVNQTTTAYGSDYNDSTDSTCKRRAGPDRVYQVDVPAGQRLTVTATPETEFDPSLSLMLAAGAVCNADNAVCVDATDTGLSGDAETVMYDNSTAETVSLYVFVDAFISSEHGSFALNVSVGPPPAGETCEGAETLTIPGVTQGTTVGYMDNYQPHVSCTGYAEDGADRIYRATIPAGQTLTVSVTGSGDITDPAVYVLPTPESYCNADPLVCLVGADQIGNDTVSYQNSSANPLDVYVVVDSTYDGRQAAFTLQASAQ